MKKYILYALIIFIPIIMEARTPKNKSFGFGIILGDPNGVSLNFADGANNSFAMSIGNSYFGNLRIGGDYLWHFNAFNSSLFHLYVGPGVAVGVGRGGGWYGRDGRLYRTSDELGVAVRGIMGIDFIPRNSSVEIFFEAGPLIGISPVSGMGFDVALGFRFYP